MLPVPVEVADPVVVVPAVLALFTFVVVVLVPVVVAVVAVVVSFLKLGTNFFTKALPVVVL